MITPPSSARATRVTGTWDVAVVSPSPVVTAGLSALLHESADRGVPRRAPGAVAADRDGVTDLGRTRAQRVVKVVLFDTMNLLDAGDHALSRLVATAGLRVVAVGHELRPDLGARALALGAYDLVTLSTTASELAEVVRAARTDSRPVATGPAAVDRRYRPGDSAGLSERERDVLAAITRGLSNREIADQLRLSVNSIKTYIRTGYRKIGVGTRSQAVLWCVNNGFPLTGDRALTG